MRTGLVGIGSAFVVVGATALAALFLVPPGTVTVQHDSTSTMVVPASGPTRSATLWGENGSGPSFSFRWSSSVPVDLDLLAPGAAANCSGPCPVQGWTTLAANWSAARSGAWSTSAPVYPYVVWARAAAGLNATISISATGTANRPATNGAFELAVSTIAGLLVLLVGGVAMFLGLFLRANPYGPPPALVSRGPEDVDQLVQRPPPGRR